MLGRVERTLLSADFDFVFDFNFIGGCPILARSLRKRGISGYRPRSTFFRAAPDARPYQRKPTERLLARRLMLLQFPVRHPIRRRKPRL